MLAAACALGVGVLAGCGSSSGAGQAASSSSSSVAGPSSSSGSASGSMPATATMIMIQNFMYKTPASVDAGAMVSVMNMDGEAHTVTSDTAGAFSVPVPPGKTVTFTAPATAGSFAFHCEYHSNMHGTLVVK
jgi:plastocyanin